MNIRLYEIHTSGEIPAYGSGHRYVFAMLGRKHAYLCSLDMKTTRVYRETFDRVMVRECVITNDTRRRLLKGAKRHMRHRRHTRLTRSVISALQSTTMTKGENDD